MLKISALLRQLIMDPQSLMDVVNRSRHLKIKFRVNDSPPTSQKWWAILDELDPDTGANTLGHWYVAASAIAVDATFSHIPTVIEVSKAQLLR